MYTYTNLPANTKNDNIRDKTFFVVLKQMKKIFKLKIEHILSIENIQIR